MKAISFSTTVTHSSIPLLFRRIARWCEYVLKSEIDLFEDPIRQIVNHQYYKPGSILVQLQVRLYGER